MYSTAQDIDSSTWKLYIPPSLTAGFFVGSFSQQAIDYWQESSPFHVMTWQNEYDDALLADKFGHASFSYTSARFFSALYEQSGYSKSHAVWLGSGISLLHQTVVEIHDGYSNGEPYLGFSRGDNIANVVGASLPVLQYYYPALDCIRFKFSFNQATTPTSQIYGSIFTDYESTYHWLSININQLLPESARTSWTPYVNIAIGHSVKNINRFGSGQHELYASLDFNAEALPIDDSWGLTLKRLLNSFKLPMPCIRILPNVVWYGLRL